MTTSIPSSGEERPARRAVSFLFVVSFVVFLIIGFALVLTQILGIIVQNGALITWAAESLTAPAVVAASLAGIFAFAYSYFGPPAR